MLFILTLVAGVDTVCNVQKVTATDFFMRIIHPPNSAAASSPPLDGVCYVYDYQIICDACWRFDRTPNLRLQEYTIVKGVCV